MSPTAKIQTLIQHLVIAAIDIKKPSSTAIHDNLWHRTINKPVASRRHQTMGTDMDYTTQEMKDARKTRLENASAKYKFMSFKYLNTLSSDEIFISDPATFNDPFDLGIAIKDLTYRGPFGDEERLRTAFAQLFLNNKDIRNFWIYDDKLINKLEDWINGNASYDQLINQFKQRTSTFGVSCFSQEWENPLMWAHYGSSHKGFCVEYTVKEMSLASTKENLHFSQYYVQYFTKLPTICLSEILFSPHQVLKNFLATKHASWSYEKEWRLVNFQEKGKAVPMPRHMEISAIIVGLKFEKEKIYDVIEKAKVLNIPVFQAHLTNDYDTRLMPL